MQSPSQPDPRASAAQEMEGRGQRDGREGKERNGQKMTVKERRPACTPDRATAQALHPCRQPSQHTRPEDSPGERQRTGEAIPLLWNKVINVGMLICQLVNGAKKYYQEASDQRKNFLDAFDELVVYDDFCSEMASKMTSDYMNRRKYKCTERDK